MATLKEITDYYVDRLVVQYKDRPKARATIALLTKQVLADYFANQIKASFDPATASGDALNKIGKYVGAPRNVGTPLSKPFFRFIDAATEAPPYTGEHGFTDSTDATINEDAVFYKVGFLEYQNNDLPDDQYRQFLAMMIFRNSSNGSFGEIADFIARFFSRWIFVQDNKDMTLTYVVSTLCPLDPQAIAAYLPKPMGVQAIILNVTPTLSPVTTSKTDIGPSSGMKTIYTEVFTAALAGGVGPYNYTWSLKVGYAGGTVAPDPGTDQATCRVALTVGTSPGVIKSWGTLSCAIKDSRGFIMTTQETPYFFTINSGLNP